jgi:hypothetical protein
MRLSVSVPAGALLAGALLLLPAPVRAQADFLFDQPHLTLSLYGGWAVAAEGSDVFDEARSELTVSEGDFSAPLIMGEIALRLSERADVALSLEHTSRSVTSNMRGWVWPDDREIVQTTDFSRTRLLVSGKYYLLPRGREISRFAWVAHRWAPYLGAGAGVSGYEFTQDGDFAVALGADPDDRDILDLRLDSSGSGFTAHGLAGVQVTLTPRTVLRGEYRYLWGSAELDSESFGGFDPIDLSGSNIMIGLSFRI